MKQTIERNDLLFHSVHGLCRVSEITRTERVAGLNYCLLPVENNRAKVRFVIPENSLEDSGFSKLMTVKEAHAILEYFKTGHKKSSNEGPAWTLATMIWSESYNKEYVKDVRKRQKLKRSIKGLSAELAFVLKFTLRKIANTIKRNLGNISSVNPAVLDALANIDKE